MIDEHPAVKDTGEYDVAIVGGGPAGLSAALNLARSRRRVIVIDGGNPRNAPASAAHGLLGHEGIAPFDLLEKGREEISAYGTPLIAAEVLEVSGTAEEGFSLVLDDGTMISAGQILIATGVRDELPAVPGLAERWGRDVVHCPYCHGWEIQDQRIGLLATGPMSAMQALLFRQWTDRLTFFPNDVDLSAEQIERVRAMGITIITGSPKELSVFDDRLVGLILDDGSTVELDALAVPALSHPRLNGLDGLGVETTTHPAGSAVVVDSAGHTSVPGVWAAGNAVNAGMQISESAANGARVGMTINVELVFADADRALADHAREGVR